VKGLKNTWMKQTNEVRKEEPNIIFLVVKGPAADAMDALQP
jgi:hypothetical protein